MSLSMTLFRRSLIRPSTLLALGFGLLLPMAAHAEGVAARSTSAPAIASIDLAGMDDCCPRPVSLTPPCENASLCAAKSSRSEVTSAAGQGIYTGFTPSFTATIADHGERLPAKLEQLPFGRPKLSVLFCSFQT